MATEHLPKRIGLCPDPGHTGEFYMPLDDRDSENCPYDCSERLAVYVPAVLSEELVRKVARAIDDEARGGLDGIRDEREDGLEGFAREALRAAGFVSEPSTGGE